MKILAPINSILDIEPVIKSGATELFCGIIPKTWSDKYGSTVSPNRREWASANITTYGQLNEITELAHQRNTQVFLTLNALYIDDQKDLVNEIIKNALKCKVDAFIVADIGLIYQLKSMNLKQEIHVSTGGTTFNSHTAKFYESLDVQRITFPRHVQPGEMKDIVSGTKNIKYEVFILNSGCKNIDGYCTFLHGIKEQKNGYLWKLFKKANFDRFVLRILQSLPQSISNKINFSCSGVDSPCLMKYDFEILSKNNEPANKILSGNLKSFFSLMSGVDPCGACRIKEFNDIGIHSLKIVGRNYSKNKKVKDVLFISDIIKKLDYNLNDADFKQYVKKQYKYYYGLNCKKLCYYPYEN
ncbi:MAG: U32 family peptidase [Endomicrobiaceae bacterium]|nr:U32 family peptidase [Endomicrobiaceae bacterium]